jgi:signal transduction histidine kinase/CheY-like chemotaxis protein
MQPLRLLVVEDSEDDYELLLARLKSAGHAIARSVRVETAEALRAAFAHKWDAVISDHRLPHFNSAQALPIVKGIDPDLPFLIVSAAIGEEVAVESMHAGADDYVMKDRLARLAPALQHALDRAADRKRQRLAEIALKESEARFRALTANLPGMVFQMHVARDGSFTLPLVSEGSDRLFQVAPEELVAAPEALLDLLDPGVRGDFRRQLLNTLRTHRDLHWECRSNPSRMLAAQWLEFAASAREQDDGSNLLDGIVSDITPNKQAEFEIRESQMQLRELASHVARVREEERETIARELHDEIGSVLTALKFDLAWLRSHSQGADADQRIMRIDRLADTAIGANQRLVRDLRPGALEFGLVAALESQTEEFRQRMNVSCRFFSEPDEIALDRERTLAVYRICQEALNNIAKYAKATSVSVEVNASATVLSLRIRDNGRGFEPAALDKKNCFGIRGMRERALSLGGRLDVAGEPGHGVCVELTLPLHAMAAE